MSDKIEVGASASGEDGILKLVSAIDRLDASLGRLAAGNTALEQLQRSMASMQASMTTGFAEMAAQAAGGAEKIRKAQEASAEKLLRDQIKHEERQHAQANKFHHKMVEMQDTWLVKQRDSYAKFWQGVLAEQERAEAKLVATQQRRDLEMHNQRTKANSDYVSLWEKMLTERQQIQERRDMELHAARQREHTDYVKFWEKHLAAQDAAQAKELAKAREQQVALHRIRAAEEERQRSLNTSFLTSSPSSQLRTAQQAQVYAGLGGNAAAKYGSAAAGADIAALQRALAQIPAAAQNSGRAIAGHNDIMREGHSLARGLAGSLGGLWLTYGSLVPLAAGAAVAASLREIVTAGKEVEHQLNFVLALTGTSVNLDKFLSITDSSLNSVTESSNAMRALAQNGLNATQSLQVLPSVLQLATVGEMTVGQAALAATGAVAAFGLEFTETGRVADIFAKTAANSNTSVLAITESMKQASTVASLFHVSIEETAAMLGLLAKINVTGGAAGTSFTNMLTGLYEPTEKGKRALKELGVEAQTSSGALKPYTQLLEELKRALSGYNDYARVDFLGDIFTVRGVKSAELALNNMDAFKQKVGEAENASDFMRNTLKQLENDSEGAFKRLAVSAENTFVRAFKEASPYIQQIGLHLADAFKDEGVQSSLSNLTTNVAQLTGFFIDHAGAVVLTVVAYKGLMALGPVITLFRTAAAAQGALTAATTAAAAANAVHATAMSAGAATAATYNAMMATNTAVTTAATAATTAWGVAVRAALGPIAIAIGAAAALWLVFRDNTNEADRANTKISNTLHTVTEQLDKEIERLEKANRLWDEHNGKFRSDVEGTPDQVNLARASYFGLRARVMQDGFDADGSRTKYTAGGTAFKEWHSLSDELKTAKENMDGFVAAAGKAEKVLSGQAVEKVRLATSGLAEDLKKFASQAEQKGTDGKFYFDNPALRDVFAKANGVRANLLDPSKRLTGDAELGRIERLRTDLQKLQDEANKMRGGRAETPDKRAVNDGFRAELQAVQNQIQASTDRTKAAQAALDSQYKVGAVSAMDYFNTTRDLAVSDLNLKLDLFKQEEEISARRDNRTADVVKFQGKQNQTAAAIAEAERARARGINEYIFQQEQDQTKRLVDEEKRRGNLRAAFTLENRDRLAQLDVNVSGGKSALAAAMAGGKQDEIELSTRFLSAARAAREAFDRELGDIGNVEDFQKAEKAFDLLFNKLQTGTAQLVQKNTEGAGLPAIFSNALAAEQLYASSLDGLIAKQRELQAIADRPGATLDQKNSALDALRAIESGSARVRDIWNDVGRDIEKALSRAFGNGGKALGALIRSTMEYSNRRKQIDEDLAKNSKGASPEALAKMQEKAAKDMASAQVSAYGDMASAAKGFFSENSRGYAALEAAEKAFRAAELVMTMKDMAMKLFATETVTTAKLAGFGAEVAGAAATVPVVVAAEGAKQSAYGVSALASALSAPFPANIPAFAMVAAMLAAIGVAVSGAGGGGKSLTAQRQELQGTGSVLGSSKSKSESISRALEMVESNTYQGLTINMQMLNSLRAIESNIGSFASLVVRTTGLSGEVPNGGLLSGSGGHSLGNAVMTGGGAVLGAMGGAYLGMGAGYLSMLGGPVTMVIGAILGAVFGKALSKLSSKIFGGEKFLEDTGLSLGNISYGSVASGGLQAMQYSDIKTKGGWFSSDKYSTSYNPLGTDADRQFAQIITSIGETIRQAGMALEIPAGAFEERLNSFVVRIGEISLKGKTGEEIEKELQAVFSKLGDDMAAFTVSGLEPWQKVGEGYLETLTRIASGYQAVSAVMDSLGMTFKYVGTNSVVAREQLIDFSGGLDKFISGSEFFLENFFSEKEQADSLRRRIQPTLDQYGLSTTGADPMKAFRDFVVGLDTATEAGARAYAALIAIAPAFKEIVEATTGRNLSKAADEAKELQDQIDELTMSRIELLKKERDALAPANQHLFDKLQQAKRESEARDLLAEAYENESSKLEATIDRLKSFGEGLRKFRDGLALGSASPLTPEQKYAASRSQFESTLARAKAGDETAQSSLESAAQAYLDASRTYNASGAAYSSDYARVVAAMEDAERWAVKEVSAATEQLTQLKATVGHLIDIKSGVMDVATAINNLALVKDPNNAALQSKAITDLYSTVFKRAPDQAGLDYWLKALQGGMSLNQISDLMKGSNEANNKPAAINDIYQQLLGRPADQAGLDFWLNALRNGSTISDIQNAIKNSGEYLGTGTGTMSGRSASLSVNSDPYAVVVNNDDVIEALADVVVAVQTVQKELETLRAEQNAQTGAQIEATMMAADNSAEKIAEATTKAVKEKAWEESNTVDMQ